MSEPRPVSGVDAEEQLRAGPSPARRAMKAVVEPPPRTTALQHVARILLGLGLLFAGISHLTFARQEFQAQVPEWVPADRDFVVVASGIVEITLGGALITLGRLRIPVGWLVAAFFVLIFPGNISQFLTRTDAFGLTSDTARGIRLIFQPILVVWALWSCGALRRRQAHESPTG